MSTKSKIRAYVLENFLFTHHNDTLRDDASFLEEGTVNSTGVPEVVMFVEEHFEFSVEDEKRVPETIPPPERLRHYVPGQYAEDTAP